MTWLTGKQVGGNILQVRRTMHSKQHQKTHQGVKDAKNGTMASISKQKASKGGP